MSLHPVFTLSEEVSEQLLELLDSTVLGTNGARYRHKDTHEKIVECDAPLHLSMVRNGRMLGNISFCRRENAWYIRYFAFAALVQSGGQKKSKTGAGEGFLKRELESFFQEVFEGKYGTEVDSFYAYIDPKNARSLWMSENFGFHTTGRIATQTYSRTRPKALPGLWKTENWTELEDLVTDSYGSFRYFTTVQCRKGPFYVWKDEDGAVLAAARIYRANWEFERLPGRFGGLLTRMIPWIPGLRHVIRPRDHRFLVPEAVCVKENRADIMQSFFEGILHAENENLLLWWIDERAPVYTAVKDKVHWGILHRLVGVHEAEVVVRSRKPEQERDPVYTIGLDFI